MPLCIIRLGIDHANISSLASNTDYTYNNLNLNTTYAIDIITAVLEDGVLSRSWTLTAATLTESSDNSENVDNSDNILPVVVGCVVSVTGIVALLVVIGVIHKRRHLEQQSEEVDTDIDGYMVSGINPGEIPTREHTAIQ